jgi:hypothetical protein
MDIIPQETKIDNLRIHADAKAKVYEVKARIQGLTQVDPSLTETITIMADHYLRTSKAA